VIYLGQEERLLRWAQQRLGLQFRPDAKTIGIASADGTLRAVTVFDTFSKVDCLVHVASDQRWGWFTREYAVRTMTYPFVDCGLTRISAMISVDNRASLMFTMRFGGWVKEGVIRRAGGHGEDLVLFGMLREHCLWLPRAPAPIEAAMLETAAGV
jgi:hypothetical protein